MRVHGDYGYFIDIFGILEKDTKQYENYNLIKFKESTGDLIILELRNLSDEKTLLDMVSFWFTWQTKDLSIVDFDFSGSVFKTMADSWLHSLSASHLKGYQEGLLIGSEEPFDEDYTSEGYQS